MELWGQLVVFSQIVLINLLLSGDNAVVIAMAGRRLPPAQRRRAVWWGAAAAVLLRCMLTVLAALLLDIPYLQTAGAVLLFVIAFKLLTDHKEEVSAGTGASTLAGAVWTIVVADFVMSLDNVLAVAAVAGEDTALLLIGIAMSIPIIIWGSSFIMHLLDRYPFLLYAGGALLAYAACEMALKDKGLAPLISLMSESGVHALPFAAAAALLSAALWTKRRSRVHS
ncbi:TerC family protein [Cohnella ginsengisoli]|uniref:TerC family protein n=1 Tax=Cohnella ginsengisoli TaxID=425004 RepID=A0A9X4QP92_9BACL|nr:TerC family protein [Cohnella ginsengisoli]MDG0793252.1 TerC family protein [Cohnella ginsengisoli]